MGCGEAASALAHDWAGGQSLRAKQRELEQEPEEQEEEKLSERSKLVNFISNSKSNKQKAAFTLFFRRIRCDDPEQELPPKN